MTPANIIPSEGSHEALDAKIRSDRDADPAEGRQKLSAVVISFNRADLIGTCLRALSFADELVVIDKSSTDGTPDLAASFADRVISIPWSPTVEESRAFAVDACAHGWVLCLDDDECLSVAGVRFIEEELRAPRADIYALPQRHYILGVHSEDAYYWPEHQPRLFRRDAVELRPTVHGGTMAKPGARIYHVPPDDGVCIHHLSHRNVEQWIDKANRYTSRADRRRADDGGRDLVAFAHARIETYIAQTKTDDRGGYPAAVAVQRAVYDMIDRLKTWESEEGLDGAAAFQAICRKLQDEYDRALPPRRAPGWRERVSRLPGRGPAGHQDGGGSERLEQAVSALRDSLRHVRTLSELAERRAAQTIEHQRVAFEEERVRAEERHRLALAETSARLTAAANEAAQAAHEETARARAAALNAIRQHSQTRARLAAQIEALTFRAQAAEARMQDEAAAARDAEERLRRVLESEFWTATAPLRSGTEFMRQAVRLQAERARLLARAAMSKHRQGRGVLAVSLRRRLGRPDGHSLPLAGQEVAAAPAEAGVALAPHEAAVASYPVWSRRFDTPHALDLEKMAATAGARPAVMVVARFTPESAHLAQRTAEALEGCVGVRWSAAFVFAPDCDSAIIVRERARAETDVRFRDIEGNVYPEGTPIILLEGGALPRTHGLRVLTDALLSVPGAVLAYADEDRLAASGSPTEPWFKPEFSPMLIEQGVLLGRMLALRPNRADAAGLLRRLNDPGSNAVSVAGAIALAGGAPSVVHVPHVLFHDAMPPLAPAPLPQPPLPDTLPLASILIPSRDGWHLLGPCLESLKRTDWPADRLEIIVVDNGSTEVETLEGIDTAERAGLIRVLRDPRPFNYAQLNNTAARASRGELLVLLNNDTEVLDPAWLRKLAAFAMQPGAGAVGPKLLYEDGTVQHGGVVLGIQGIAVHAHLELDATDGGYQGLANLTHEVMAVTGACLAVSRAAFEAVGGLDETFRVALNDVVLCLDLHAHGRRNVYVAEPLLTHHESKTRGDNDTAQKVGVFRREIQLAWRRHGRLLRDDPFYSPNLSLEAPYQLAFAPRRRPAWRERTGSRLRVLILSATHARGDDVAVVIHLQVSALLARGDEVIVAGHRSDRDLSYEGQEVIEVLDPRSAATLAADMEADIIIAHTPPFFGVARWTGAFPPVLACDHGEPPPDLFPDAALRREILSDKDTSLSMCTRVLAISEAIAAEARIRPDGVLPPGNSHLGRWGPAAADRRRRIRRERGWESLYVVLNVCPLHGEERACKGVGVYADVREALEVADSALAARTTFVLSGKGDPEDVQAMRNRGLEVMANVSDEEMIDLYAAADAYANFSRWEGYNLGIGQALAMGLPVIASDILAHRAFGVAVTNDAGEAALLLSELAAQPAERVSTIWEWDDVLAAFIAEVESVCSGQTHGASPPSLDSGPD